MITTKIQLTPYLAEYLNSKYMSESGYVEIPPKSDLYHLVWKEMQRRPANVIFDEGNVEIVLPKRRRGKNPMWYNYISSRGSRLINRYVKAMFDYELHQLILCNIHKGRPVRDLDIVNQFIQDCGLHSISEDGLIKNCYRWRQQFLCPEKN